MESVGISQIAAVMATASVGVVPKRSDGFGNEAFSTKILEFMACGVPVIVSRTRIDQHYFTERLVNFFQPADAADLAHELLKAYRNPADQVERIRAAQDFSERHSWQARSGDYRLLVDSLAAGSSYQETAVAPL
jgi:glycosyltransferase involved in cell wall biosynthesis